ncbi:MAG TPA: rod shape-determining protein MreC [Anaerolineaceae bacterium]|nr:rod shape-determining protein MreC [Anaerolineaceae bacterium]
MRIDSPRTLRTIVITLVVIGVILLAFSGILRPVFGKVMDPFIKIQGWLSSQFLAVYDFFTLPRDVTDLIAENTELKNEVSQLQSQVIELQEQLSEADILYALLDFARAKPENTYVAASVIGRDPNPFMHYLIIDHGSDDGLRYGMPVVTQQGLVGKIDAVTASAARVQLITDPDSTINVRMQSLNEEAQLIGSITGDIELTMIPTDVNLQAGEILLTSGLGGTYPADIVVGQVMNVQHKENDIFQSAVVQSEIDFSTLRAVLVITNFTAIDIDLLTND